MGAGYLALVRAANGFDPACGTTFSTYAIVAIRRAMIEQANRERAGLFPVARRLSGRAIAMTLPRTISLDASPDGILAHLLVDDPEQRPEAVALRRAARKALWDTVSRVLTEHEARVIVLHYGSSSEGAPRDAPYRPGDEGKLSAIATHLGTSRQNVHEMHGRALRKLRQKLPRRMAEAFAPVPGENFPP